MQNIYKLYPLGDQGITLVFGDSINVKIHAQVNQAMQMLKKINHDAIIEAVPTYTTITLYYNPKQASFREMKNLIDDCLANAAQTEISTDTRVIEIPVCYGGSYGPDLSIVAHYNNLSEEEVIHKHSSKIYLIYMMGFLPGFPYLGGLPTELATPRLTSPRRSVQAGSVGIAGSQTGIYPLDSPGGWNIIGQTPVNIYQPENHAPFLLKAGHYIKFKPISSTDFTDMRKDGF